MRIVLTTTCALLLSAPAAASSTHVPLQPGNYVITYTMKMNGESLGKPERSHPHCLTSADMSDPEAVFSQNAYNGMGRNPQCKIAGLAADGGKFSYELECPRSTDHVEATLTADSFTVTRSAKGRTSRAVGVVTQVDGKRVGDCRK